MRTDYFANLICPGTQNQTGADANPHRYSVAPVAPIAPVQNGEAEKNDARQVLFTHFGKGYRHPDGRVESGQPEPTPRPTQAWPADLDRMLTRVSCAFEWSGNDRRDFIAWARRSPEGMADARQFLEHEVSKLPEPGMTDRRRFVLERLQADPSLRVAWLCEDDGADPVILTIAIRDKGTAELAIPRAKFNALALPMLIANLKQESTP